MDGVIVDNHRYHLDAWEQFCYKHKCKFDKNGFTSHFFGKSNREIINELMPDSLTLSEIDLLGEEKEVYYRNLYRDSITLVQGLEEVLRYVKAKGIKVALASSAPLSNIDFTLDALNIRNHFEVIVDASMVKQSKPNPDIYLKASELLMVSPSQCVVFEDSHAGIKSALSAGMEVIVLATTHPEEDLNYNLTIIKNYTNLLGAEFQVG